MRLVVALTFAFLSSFAAGQEPKPADKKGPDPKSISDYSIHSDYGNEIKGDKLYKDKELLVELFPASVKKAGEDYVVMSWCLEDDSNARTHCAAFFISKDDAEPFGDVRPGNSRIVVKATCLGKSAQANSRNGYVVIFDKAKFVKAVR